MFANDLGVMVIPELDGPSHVSSGYQWGNTAGLGDLVVCTDPEGTHQDSWTKSGLEPPSGQLNLGNDNIYSLLRDVHAEILSAFPMSSYFHVGGDELIIGSDEAWAQCYNSSAKAPDVLSRLDAMGLDASDPQSFYQLWKDYNKRMETILDEVFSSATAVDAAVPLKKLHIWGGGGDDASGVTYNMMTQKDVTTALPPAKYTIQVWDTSSDSIVPTLVGQGYDVILSNTDYVYLDCGNAGWAHAGGYWCQPYHEWQHIYQYISDVTKIWKMHPKDFSAHVLGSETLAWSEMISSVNVEQKVWPRTAALGEALWGRTAKKGSSWYAADPRLQVWTRVLLARGVSTEPLQTRWCSQRGAYSCTVDSGVPQ